MKKLTEEELEDEKAEARRLIAELINEKLKNKPNGTAAALADLTAEVSRQVGCPDEESFIRFMKRSWKYAQSKKLPLTMKPGSEENIH